MILQLLPFATHVLTNFDVPLVSTVTQPLTFIFQIGQGWFKFNFLITVGYNLYKRPRGVELLTSEVVQGFSNHPHVVQCVGSGQLSAFCLAPIPCFGECSNVFGHLVASLY